MDEIKLHDACSCFKIVEMQKQLNVIASTLKHLASKLRRAWVDGEKPIDVDYGVAVVLDNMTREIDAYLEFGVVKRNIQIVLDYTALEVLLSRSGLQVDRVHLQVDPSVFDNLPRLFESVTFDK